MEVIRTIDERHVKLRQAPSKQKIDELLYGYHFYVACLLKIIERTGKGQLTEDEIAEMTSHKNFVDNVKANIFK